MARVCSPLACHMPSWQCSVTALSVPPGCFVPQVRYLVEPPPQGADPKRSFKYPFTACEIFCCEVRGPLQLPAHGRPAPATSAGHGC